MGSSLQHRRGRRTRHAQAEKNPPSPACAAAPAVRGLASPLRLRWALALAVAATTFLVFLPALNSDLVYDSRPQILADPFIHTPAHIADVLTLRVLGMDVLDRDRPGMLLSLMLDSMVWGKRAFGYHLTSVLLHAANAALLMLLMVHLLLRFPSADRDKGGVRITVAALFGTFVFALHPLTVEAVSVISFREDLLALFFVLSALLLATRFPAATRRGNLLVGSAVTAACLLAVTCKETGAGAPVLVAAYWWLFRRHEEGRAAWVKLITAALGVVLLFVAIRLLREPATAWIVTKPPPRAAGSSAALLSLQLRLFAFYLRQTVWPLWLCVNYGGWSIRHFGFPLAAAVTAAVTGMWLWAAWKSRVAFFSLLLFGAGMLPVSNLVPIFVPAADRYLYMPLGAVGILLSLAAVWLLDDWRKPVLQVLLGVIAVSLLAFLTTLSVQRQEVMGSRIGLWQDTLAKNPMSLAAANNLGYALYAAGQPQAAVAAWERAVKMGRTPQPDALAGLAIGQYAIGEHAAARQSLLKAIAMDSRYASPQQLVRALIWETEPASDLQHVLDELKIQPAHFMNNE